ncbi:hypothetical protein Tco_0498353, partial [Tanacetum coccineum]
MVTYTSVYTDSELWRFHPKHPHAPDYVPGLEEPEQAPLSPDYVPEPEYS